MSRRPVNAKENATLNSEGGLLIRVYVDPNDKAWWRSPSSGLWYDIQVSSDESIEYDYEAQSGGGKTMERIGYTVIAVHENGRQYLASTGIQNPALAKTLVQAAKRDYPSCQIFVQWKRLSDGQVGYLNPDGNHVITGSAW